MGLTIAGRMRDTGLECQRGFKPPDLLTLFKKGREKSPAKLRVLSIC
jgi:hypothetical protein